VQPVKTEEMPKWLSDEYERASVLHDDKPDMAFTTTIVRVDGAYQLNNLAHEHDTWLAHAYFRAIQEAKNASIIPPSAPARKDTGRFLRLSSVMELTGLSRSTIYRMSAEGAFPKNIKLGKLSSAWRESEILDWLDSRVHASRSPSVDANPKVLVEQSSMHASFNTASWIEKRAADIMEEWGW